MRSAFLVICLALALISINAIGSAGGGGFRGTSSAPRMSSHSSSAPRMSSHSSAAPRMNSHSYSAPKFSAPSHNPVRITSPKINSPKVNIPSPKPKINVPAPKPKINVPAPKPKINVPAPHPKVNVPPKVNTPVHPKVNTPKVNPTPVQTPKTPVQTPKTPVQTPKTPTTPVQTPKTPTTPVQTPKTPTPTGKGLTYETLQKMMPEANKKVLQQYTPFINQAMQDAGINTPARQNAFLAQIAHESGQFKFMTEQASGKAYEGRKDIGNIYPGDGVKYKGRGPIQITGREEYTKAAKAIGVDIVNHPELVATPEVGFKTAAWSWNTNHLNKFADQNTPQSFSHITKVINGCANCPQTHADRRNALWRNNEKINPTN